MEFLNLVARSRLDRLNFPLAGLDNKQLLKILEIKNFDTYGFKGITLWIIKFIGGLCQGREVWGFFLVLSGINNPEKYIHTGLPWTSHKCVLCPQEAKPLKSVENRSWNI